METCCKTNLGHHKILHQSVVGQTIIPMSLNAPKLPDLTRKGDIATFGLGYGAGFALGIFLFGGNGSPSPLTVALVVAIVCVALKYGYEARQEEPPAEEPQMAEHQRRKDRLRARFNGLEQALDFSVIFTGYGGEVSRASLGSSEVLFEHHWEPNPNYDPQPVDVTEERPYIRHENRGDVSHRLVVLRLLWEAGAITDEYAEARLNELSDLTYQQVHLQQFRTLRPEELKPEELKIMQRLGIVQPAPEEPGSSS
jgi:hypothetical protein